jgi:hypothetical protein
MRKMLKIIVLGEKMEFCKYCRRQIARGAKYCQGCGESHTQSNYSATNYNYQSQMPQISQPTYQRHYHTTPTYERQYQTIPTYVKPTNGSGKAVASLVLGICSLVLPFLGFICAILGLIFALCAKKDGYNGGIQTAGFITSILGLFGYVLVIIFIFLLPMLLNELLWGFW